MCIVNYIPTSEDSFVLTYSRDESIKRPLSSPPIIKSINGTKHLFPVDIQGRGTWIAASETGRLACILNGTEKHHQHQPPYRHSRGLIIPAYFSFHSYPAFFRSYNFRGLEPFTLLVFENQKIYACLFSGKELTTRELDPSQAFLLASSSIYTDDVRQSKKDDFKAWYDKFPTASYSEIIKRNMNHRFELETDQSLAAGHHVQTVSMTSIFHDSGKTRMDYYDLVNDVHIDRVLRQRSIIPA